MKKRYILPIFIFLAALVWFGAKFVIFNYPVYEATTVVNVDRPYSEMSQDRGGFSLFSDQGKRVAEFSQVVYGASVARNLLEIPEIAREALVWANSQPLRFEPRTQADVNVEMMRGFLNKSLNIEVLHDSGILKLRAYSAEPKISGLILEKVLAYYRDDRRSYEISLLEGQIEQLSSELQNYQVNSVNLSISTQISLLLKQRAMLAADNFYGVEILDELYTKDNPSNTSPVVMVLFSIFLASIGTLLIVMAYGILRFSRHRE